MADQSVANPISLNSEGLAVPPLDPSIFSEDLSLPDNFISDFDGSFDADIEDFEFTFDDLCLPSDTEDFLNSLPGAIEPHVSDPALIATDPGLINPGLSSTHDLDQNSGCSDQQNGDRSLSGARVYNTPSPVAGQSSDDQSPDISKFLNTFPESSCQFGNKNSDPARVLDYPSSESETLNREVSGPTSSQGSGNCGSNGSEALNCPSPDSGNCARSAASSPNCANKSTNGIVDQKIKLEEEGSNCLLKRKKENGDVNFESRMSKYRRSHVVDSSNSPNGFSATTTDEEDKRKARLMRNRESAQLSRQRKKHYVDELEDKVRNMHSTIQDLSSKISYIMAENASLRQQLSGGAMCPSPVAPPGMYSHPPMAPVGYPWAPYPPYVVKPQGSQVPLVPIPRLKSQQPASAPKVKKSESKKAEAKKTETKSKKVASVSFLGLLFFILLFGGLVPMVNVKFGGTKDTVLGGSHPDSRFYEHYGTVLAVNGHVNGSHLDIIGRHGTGRVHCGTGRCGGRQSNIEGKEDSQPFPRSDEFVPRGNSSEPLVASLFVPRNDKLVKIDGNLIIHSVLASEKAMASCQNDGKRSGEETSLATIPYTGRSAGGHPHIYRSSSDRQRALGSGPGEERNLKSKLADGKLQQWFLEGLSGPMLSSGMCTEVFQFDASPAPGAMVPATSVVNTSAERRQNATHLAKGRNRRILHGAPIPLPGAKNNNITKEPVGVNPKKDGLRSNNSGPPMVVSVLVDPREAGDSDGDGVMGPKALSRIFVVVLIDSVKYVTYSCMLPFKGSGSPLVTT